MTHEKSCGAVIFTRKNGECRFLVEHMVKGHYSLCKGHVEGQETEKETAVREIMEETGITVSFLGDFRHAVEYSPAPGRWKQVVFFLAGADSTETTAQKEEVREILWLTEQEALARFTYETDKETLSLAVQAIAEGGF